jgi:hypothetical protein
MRQYWRDYESLERWSRSEPHRRWWQEYLQDSGGTGFWHETYFRGGGFEAIYDDMVAPIGMMRFAPVVPARGAMFSARRRARLGGRLVEPVVTEQRLYAEESGPSRRGRLAHQRKHFGASHDASDPPRLKHGDALRRLPAGPAR